MNAQKKEEDLFLDFSDMEGLNSIERIDRLQSAFQQTPEEKLQQLSIDYQKVLFSSGQLQEERNELLEENIQLGEALEKANEMLLQERAKNKALSRKIKELLEVQDKGKLSLHARLIQMNLAHKDQNAQIKELKEKMKHIGRAPIKKAVEDQIVHLRNEGYSYSQISKYLGVSRSTISKYLNKKENRKRLVDGQPGWTTTIRYQN